jgi:hypothetical protein
MGAKISTKLILYRDPATATEKVTQTSTEMKDMDT